MGLVARVSCRICARMGIDGTPSQVHHLKFGTGMTNKSPDFLTIALCPEHHTGASGVHQLKERGLMLRYKCSELDLLADTIEEIARRF
jgi:hypothetical protein